MQSIFDNRTALLLKEELFGELDIFFNVPATNMIHTNLLQEHQLMLKSQLEVELKEHLLS